MNPRLRRLQADYELIRDSLSGHPLITVEPASATLPPESYRIQYRIKGLQLEGEQPVFRDVHEVQLDLPLRYPAERPYAVPLSPVFHPNIKEYFCIADYWAAGTTLVDVIAKMGDMIQWKIYNVKSPLDTTAARWASANETSGIFPVGNVEFGVEEIEISLKPGNAEEAEVEPSEPAAAEDDVTATPDAEPNEATTDAPAPPSGGDRLEVKFKD